MNVFHALLANILRPFILSSARRRQSKRNGEFRVKGLEGEVEIRRDSIGVPHIYASHEHDLFFAQGFAQAQDRLFQMDLARRLARGKLSELFGRLALDTDRITRTLGFARLAEKDLALIKPELKALLESYVKGINAGCSHFGKRLPVEYALLKTRPEAWTLHDVLSLARMMAMQLSTGWGHEIVRDGLLKKLGPELFEALDLSYSEDHPSTLPDGIDTNVIEADGRLTAFKGPFLKPASGSNAWAISGELTDTGSPYLCSDPHLPLMTPGIWYQNHLIGENLHIAGVSVPGLPLVMIGHNDRISWGMTLSFTDIQDVFVERFRDKGAAEYLFDGQWIRAKVLHEEITVKGGGVHREKVLITRHGPVISEIVPSGEQKLSLCSQALQPGEFTAGFYALNYAKGWNDFVDALRYLDAPGLNVVYADVEGNTGYWVSGKSPVRGKGKGAFPAKGWTSKEEWQGAVPFEEMPHAFNPQQGYVISCNHKVVGEDYPWFLGEIWMNGFRAKRLESLIEQGKPKMEGQGGGKGSEGSGANAAKGDKLDIEAMQAMQLDLFSLPGLRFAKHYRDFVHEYHLVQEAAEILVTWDGYLGEKSVGGSIYQVCRREMLLLLFQDRIGPGFFDYLTGDGIDPFLFPQNELLGHDTVALLRVLDDPDSKWLTPVGGKPALLSQAMENAVTWFVKKIGKKPEKWQWGKLHAFSLDHAFAERPFLGKIFSTGPVEIGGDTDTLNQTAFYPAQPYQGGLSCASYRQVVDLGDLSRSVWVMPPGNVGQLGSDHYQDQLAAWREGKYFPMWWTNEQVEADTRDLLKLYSQ